MPPPEPLSVSDFETFAQQRMEPGAPDCFPGAAGDEWTLPENVRAFTRIALCPRVLIDVGTIGTSTSLVGDTLPLLLRGEVELAMALAGCPSITSITPSL